MIYGGLFDLDSKEKRIIELEDIMNDPNFWNNSNTNEVIEELNSIKDIVNKIKQIKNNIVENIELCNMLDKDDLEIKNILESDIDNIKKLIEEEKLLLLLNGPYDKNNCICCFAEYSRSYSP